MYTRRHWNEAVFTEDELNRTTFLQLNIYGTSLDKGQGWNDVNNSMDRALHKKWDIIPMAVVQKLISSMTRRCVGA